MVRLHLDEVDHLPDREKLLDFFDEIGMLNADDGPVDRRAGGLLFRERVENDRQAVVAGLLSG